MPRKVLEKYLEYRYVAIGKHQTKIGYGLGMMVRLIGISNGRCKGDQSKALIILNVRANSLMISSAHLLEEFPSKCL